MAEGTSRISRNLRDSLKRGSQRFSSSSSTSNKTQKLNAGIFCERIRHCLCKFIPCIE